MCALGKEWFLICLKIKNIKIKNELYLTILKKYAKMDVGKMKKTRIILKSHEVKNEIYRINKENRRK